jgi:hypothetical protein
MEQKSQQEANNILRAQFIEEMPKTPQRALTAQQHNTWLTNVTILHPTTQLRKISKLVRLTYT